MFSQPLNFAVLLTLVAISSIANPASAVAQTAPITQAGPPNHPQKAPEKPAAESKGAQWTQLFNGRDLSGWTPKIMGHELGVNYANTFRVEDGVLKVAYDGYVPADFKSMDGTRDLFEKFWPPVLQR